MSVETNPVFSLDCEILEYTKSPFKGKDGELVNYAYVLIRYAGKIFKISASQDFSAYIGKVASSHKFEMRSSKDLKIGLRLIS